MVSPDLSKQRAVWDHRHPLQTGVDGHKPATKELEQVPLEGSDSHLASEALPQMCLDGGGVSHVSFLFFGVVVAVLLRCPSAPHWRAFTVMCACVGWGRQVRWGGGNNNRFTCYAMPSLCFWASCQMTCAVCCAWTGAITFGSRATPLAVLSASSPT